MLARSFTSLAAGVLLALTFPSTAAAEWHFVPTIGWTFKADTSIFDPEGGTSRVHWNFGGTVTLVGSGILGVEGMFVWTPRFFNNDQSPVQFVSKSHTFAMMGNVLLTTPRHWTEYGLRPFVSGGLGVLRVSRTDVTPIFPGTGNIPAFNIGGGAIGFLSKRTGVRFDLRYYNNLTPSEDTCPTTIGQCHLRYMTFTAGVVIRR